MPVAATPRLPRTDPTVDAVELADVFTATRDLEDLALSAGGPIVLADCAEMVGFAGEAARPR